MKSFERHKYHQLILALVITITQQNKQLENISLPLPFSWVLFFQTEYLDIVAGGPISFTFKQYIWGPLEQRQLMSRTLFEIQQSNALKYQNLILQSALGFIIIYSFIYDFPNHTMVTYNCALSTHPKGSLEFWPSSIFIPRKTSTNPILCIQAIHC